MTSSPRVRFAPSPTGYLHVGGARTALFDWLFARKYNGTFILRIEDTDVERSSEAMTQGILDAMKWLGLDWDEGPYHQSRRLDTYRKAALRLAESGHAYYCFCSPELLEQKRREAASRKIDWKYDRACAGLSQEEVRQRIASSQRAAIRFRVPEGPVMYKDEIFGDITVESETIEDFVLVRSDAHPTYHLSVVVDDIDMHITHVIRGADHISNTPKQLLLYRALNAPIPVFAHLPLLLGPDKTRLSKRHGATSVMAYQEQGILPEALRNFLALLGWSPGTDQEMFETDELIQSFSLAGISKANAVFNPEKLAWFNAQYIQKLPYPKLIGYLKPEFQKAGLWRDEFEGERYAWFCKLLDVLRPRSKSLHDFPRQARMFILETVEFDSTAVEKSLKNVQAKQYLTALADRLSSLGEFTLESTEAATRRLAEELAVKPAALISPARVALTGVAASPGIFDVMTILGKERTVSRLRESAER